MVSRDTFCGVSSQENSVKEINPKISKAKKRKCVTIEDSDDDFEEICSKRNVVSVDHTTGPHQSVHTEGRQYIVLDGDSSDTDTY